MREVSVARSNNVRGTIAPRSRPLQRKCACGSHTPGGGACPSCSDRESRLQRKLAVGAASDPLEHEADRIAEQVLAAPTRADVGHAPPRIQRVSAQPAAAAIEAPANVAAVVGAPGRVLDAPLRDDMEARFGHDFSAVRIHTDSAAAQSARDVAARAFTIDSAVVFGAGQFAPGTADGLRLIAHELAHVVQQGSAAGRTIRRKGILDEIEDLGRGIAKAGEGEVRSQLRKLAELPGTGALFSTAKCPANFCNPFADVTEAKVNLGLTAPVLLAGVAKVVSPRVVPLWSAYLFGGSSPRNISSDFAGDFTNSVTTAATAAFIHDQVKIEVTRSHASLFAPPGPVTIDLTPRMGRTLAAIDKQGDPHVMDFNVIGEIPGNLAGGVGKDQLASQIGARPSPFNDERGATITVTMTQIPAGILIQPQVTFKVRDTIDLCPGNCGALTEQDATIPMSRFEATGLSGDVPFEVDFPAPAAAMPAFVVSAPSPAATPKKATKPGKGPGKGKVPSGGSKPAGHKTALNAADSAPGGVADGSDVDLVADEGIVA